MKKNVLICLLLFSFVFAKEDYSEMSTQELIAIIGYVKEDNKDSFLKELNSRISNHLLFLSKCYRYSLIISNYITISKFKVISFSIY